VTTTNSLNNETYNANFTVNAQGASAVGVTRSDSVVHADNTNAASSARQLLQVGGAVGGDPYVEMLINGVRGWAMGPDNSGGDSLLINTAAGTVSPSSGTNIWFYNSSGDLIGTSTSNIGVRKVLFHQNIDATSGLSDSELQLANGGVAGGDVYTRTLTVGTGTSFIEGIDNSANTYKLEYNPAITQFGTGTLCTQSTTAGAVTMPNTPAFFAYRSATLANVTGTGGTFGPIIFDTETVDQGAGYYDNATGIFTAPVTGVYLISCAILLGGVGATHTACSFVVVTPNQTDGVRLSPASIRDTANNCTLETHVITNLAAGATASAFINVSGAALTVDIMGQAGLARQSWFAAQLLC